MPWPNVSSKPPDSGSACPGFFPRLASWHCSKTGIRMVQAVWINNQYPDDTQSADDQAHPHPGRSAAR